MSLATIPDRCPIEPRPPDNFEVFASVDLGAGRILIFDRELREAWIESSVAFARDDMC